MEKLIITYQADSSCVIMSIILMTTLFHKALNEIDITRRSLMLITTSRFENLEKSSLNFSSALFAIRVNLLHP